MTKVKELKELIIERLEAFNQFPIIWKNGARYYRLSTSFYNAMNLRARAEQVRVRRVFYRLFNKLYSNVIIKIDDNEKTFQFFLSENFLEEYLVNCYLSYRNRKQVFAINKNKFPFNYLHELRYRLLLCIYSTDYVKTIPKAYITKYYYILAKPTEKENNISLFHAALKISSIQETIKQEKINLLLANQEDIEKLIKPYNKILTYKIL